MEKYIIAYSVILSTACIVTFVVRKYLREDQKRFAYPLMATLLNLSICVTGVRMILGGSSDHSGYEAIGWLLLAAATVGGITVVFRQRNLGDVVNH